MTDPTTAARDIDPEIVERYLRSLQQRVCDALEAIDGTARFFHDAWSRDEGGPDTVPERSEVGAGGAAPLGPAPALSWHRVPSGGGESRVLSDGTVFERAGVNFSDIRGTRLPPAATAARPELVGRSYRAMGVSLVVHPRNPYVPTVHMNVRFLIAEAPGQAPVWWFGGGFDLTPYYGFEDDARHWHRNAHAACEPFGPDVHARLKKQCDDYFYIKHRKEPRGIGGLFYDDWTEGGFERSFALMQSVGDRFLPGYRPIVERRKDMPYTERERDWQLYRRGRYVEFNLVWDRGTLFGLQSNGRIESILMSMPPLVAWRYDHQPAAGTAEAELYDRYLKPQDWR